MKLLAILLCLMLVSSAMAGRERWGSRDPVAKCIKDKKCGGTYGPVCAFNAGTGQLGGFPSLCYMKCANAGSVGFGNRWVKKYHYKAPRICKTKWLAFPEECSTCPEW